MLRVLQVSLSIESVSNRGDLNEYNAPPKSSVLTMRKSPARKLKHHARGQSVILPRHQTDYPKVRTNVLFYFLEISHKFLLSTSKCKRKKVISRNKVTMPKYRRTIASSGRRNGSYWKTCSSRTLKTKIRAKSKVVSRSTSSRASERHHSSENLHLKSRLPRECFVSGLVFIDVWHVMSLKLNEKYFRRAKAKLRLKTGYFPCRVPSRWIWSRFCANQSRSNTKLPGQRSGGNKICEISNRLTTEKRLKIWMIWASQSISFRYEKSNLNIDALPIFSNADLNSLQEIKNSPLKVASVTRCQGLSDHMEDEFVVVSDTKNIKKSTNERYSFFGVFDGTGSRPFQK